MTARERKQASQGRARQAEGKMENRYVIKVMKVRGCAVPLVFAESKDASRLPIDQ